MSMQRRYEPMGGEGDSNPVISSVNIFTPKNRTNDEIGSIPPDSIVDELTLKVRSLLMNFEDPVEEASEVNPDIRISVSRHSEGSQSSCNQNEVLASVAPSTNTNYACSRGSYDSQSVIGSKCDHQDVCYLKKENIAEQHRLTSFGKHTKPDIVTDGDDESTNEFYIRSPKSHSELYFHVSQSGIKSNTDQPKISLTKIPENKLAPHDINPPSFIPLKWENVDNPLSYETFSKDLHTENPDIRLNSTKHLFEDKVNGKSQKEPQTSHELSVGTNSRNKNLGKYTFPSRLDFQNSAYAELTSKNDALEKETERSWSEITVAAESYLKPPDVLSTKVTSLNSNLKQRLLPPTHLSIPEIENNKNANSVKFSMPIRHTDIVKSLCDDGKVNVLNSEGNILDIDKEYEFSNFHSFSGSSDFEQETPPHSASSLGSSKRLEWDNGADIGYSIANVNSKLKRKIPNTERSEPEGISLINEPVTVNNDGAQSSTGVSTLLFSSSLSPPISPNPNVLLSGNALIDNNSACKVSPEDDLLEQSSSPEASMSRSDSKKSVIYNSARDMTSKILDLNFTKNVRHLSKNLSCPDLTDVEKNSVGFQNWVKTFSFEKLSKSDEGVSLNKKTQADPKAIILDTSCFPSVIAVGEALERKLFGKFNRSEEIRDSKLFDLQTSSKKNSSDSLSHTCKSCHQPLLKINVNDDNQHGKSESEGLFRSRNDSEVVFDVSNDCSQLYNVMHLSQHDAIVNWMDGNAVFDTDLHYVAEMPELPADCHFDALHSRPFLFLSNNLTKMNENHVSRNVGNMFTNTNDSPANGNLEVKPHIRWYPFTSTADVQDIKNVSTQTAMSFIAKQFSRSPTQVVCEQQTSSPEESKFVNQIEDHSKMCSDMSNINQKHLVDHHTNCFSNTSESSNSPEFHSSSETVLTINQRLCKDKSSNLKSSSKQLYSSSQENVVPSKSKQYLSRENGEQSGHTVENSQYNQDQFVGTFPQKIVDDFLSNQYIKEISGFKKSSLPHIKYSLNSSDKFRSNPKEVYWTTEKAIRDIKSGQSTPDLPDNERKLGVGQFDIPQKSPIREVGMTVSSGTIYKDVLSQKHSPISHSASDPVNYPHVECGLSLEAEDDDVLPSSARSSIASPAIDPTSKSEIPQKFGFAHESSICGPYEIAENFPEISTQINFPKNLSMAQHNAFNDDDEPFDKFSGNMLNHNSQDIINDANSVILDAKRISAAVNRLAPEAFCSQSRHLLGSQSVINQVIIPKSHSDPSLSAQNSKHNLTTQEESYQIPSNCDYLFNKKNDSEIDLNNKKLFDSHEILDLRNPAVFNSHEKLDIRNQKLFDSHERLGDISYSLEPKNRSELNDHIWLNRNLLKNSSSTPLSECSGLLHNMHKYGTNNKTQTCFSDQIPLIEDSNENRLFSNRSEAINRSLMPCQPSEEFHDNSRTKLEHGTTSSNRRSHGVFPSVNYESNDNKKYSKLIKSASVGIQVSQPLSILQKCSFCHRAINTHLSHCTERDKFKSFLNDTLGNRLGFLNTKQGRSGASFCVFSSGCFCCCNRTLQEAFNFHRSELVHKIESRKNELVEKSRKCFLAKFSTKPSSQRFQSPKRKEVKATNVSEKSSSNKENKHRNRRNYVPSNTVSNKQKNRQKSLNNYNRIMLKIYSQRLKNETLKGKVNFERHENLITS